MIRIQASLTINRPLEEVFRFMTNHQNALQWQSGLLEARVTNDVIGIGKTWWMSCRSSAGASRSPRS